MTSGAGPARGATGTWEQGPPDFQNSPRCWRWPSERPEEACREAEPGPHWRRGRAGRRGLAGQSLSSSFRPLESRDATSQAQGSVTKALPEGAPAIALGRRILAEPALVAAWLFCRSQLPGPGLQAGPPVRGLLAWAPEGRRGWGAQGDATSNGHPDTCWHQAPSGQAKLTSTRPLGIMDICPGDRDGHSRDGPGPLGGSSGSLACSLLHPTRASWCGEGLPAPVEPSLPSSAAQSPD